MDNGGYSRQGNPFPGDEINSRIIQGNNFSGTVVEALQNAPPAGPDAPDIVWGGDWRVSRDAVDGSNGGVIVPPRVGVPAVMPRARVIGYSTPEVTSPMQRAQEQANQAPEPPVYITVRRRTTPLDNGEILVGISEEEKEIYLRETRAALVQEYNNTTDPTLWRLLTSCASLLSIDVNIESKYAELDIWRVFEANKEKSRFLHLNQGLGILEKYASNLIKESRPPYWRTVKFTSSLVQVHVGRLIGSRDILSQMGYTQDIDDGVAFPSNVPEPDVIRLRDLAPDLFFARYEIDALLVNNHPFYEMDPPVPQDEVQLPVLMQASFPPSRPQPFPSRASAPLSGSPHPVVVTTGTPTSPLSGNVLASPRNTDNQPSRTPSSPTPAARRQGGKQPINPTGGKESKAATEFMQEPQPVMESEEDSDEYEDAEAGILPSNGSAQMQAQTNFECRVCGESVASKFCKDCKDTFCVACDSLYHKHPSRQRHVRTDLVTPTATPSMEQLLVGTVAGVGAGAATTAVTGTTGERQTYRAAASTAAATSGGEESRLNRPRPVPAPRRNKPPPPSHQGMAHGTTEPEEEEPPPPLPPRQPYAADQRQQTMPNSPIIQKSAYPRSHGISQSNTPTSSPVMTSSTVRSPPSVVGTQSMFSQPVVSTSGQAHSQRRDILRPPPFVHHINTATQQSSPSATDGRDNKPIVKSPPPLAPKPSSSAQPKIPVESKTPSQGSTSPERGAALSCPNCYCLNSGDAKTCLFCKKPLPSKAHQEPASQPMSSQQNAFLETRNFPAPTWALSPDQRAATSQMQQPQGNVNVAASSGAGKVSVDLDKWECEYCTYHNPRTRRICEICCKTNSNISPQPSKNAVSSATDTSAQQAIPRETQNPEHLRVVPPQNVTNMGMQINNQQMQTATEQTKKADPQNLQAAPAGTPTRTTAEPPMGNTFPAQVNQQARPWEYVVRATPANPSGPPSGSAFPGVVSPGQGGILNSAGMVTPEFPVRSSFPGIASYGQGGMVAPGAIPEVPVRSPFARDAGLPYGPQGFPPPPPMMIQPAATIGPELPVAGSFPAPIGNSFLQQHFSSGFPQPPPFAAWVAPPPDEAIRRQQEEIYIAGSHYVEWLKKAEKEGFTAEEVNIASVLGIDDLQGPIHWLQTAWYDLIHKVMVELAVPENSQEIGNVSPEEVREALIECTGEVSRATTKCMEIRKKKVKELQQAGVYAKTDCITALDTSEGDTEQAILALEKMSMRPMLQRVLNSCLPDHASQGEVIMALTRQTNTQSPQDKANFEAIVKDKGQNLDRRIRAVLAEKDIPSWGRAETAIKLIDMDYSVEDSIEAARNCGDLPRSLRYLQQECPLCCAEKPMSQMVTFLHCQDRVCQECVTRYITITIKDKNIMHLVCPCCGKPDNLDDEAVATEYFNNFDILIRNLVDKETHDLFQRKLRDRTLRKEPNFRWCSHCSSGFINEQPGQIRMMCPHCQQFTCFKCKRQWEDQHEGITCEQFAAWKEANDPEFQAAGLAAHLKMNGIVCPDCKYRYDLSKGGCMHFKCAMCPHEFCSGCYNPFLNTNAQNCPVSEQCTVRGLHAHHPRDCYFYLRDRSTEELQKLLRDNNVAYNTEPPEAQGNAGSDDEAPPGAAAAAGPLHCKVSEQKETENGLVDAECGAEVPAGHAGLCGKHYVEYLVVLVNDNLLDPADIMSSDDLKRVLERGFVDPPGRTNRMNDEQYKQLLLRTVKEQLPLPPKPPRKRVLDDEDEVQVVLNNGNDDDSDEEDDDDDDDIIAGPRLRPFVLEEDHGLDFAI